MILSESPLHHGQGGILGVPTWLLSSGRRALHGMQEDGAFVRIKLVSCETLKSKVLSLKQDLKYWPTW